MPKQMADITANKHGSFDTNHLVTSVFAGYAAVTTRVCQRKSEQRQRRAKTEVHASAIISLTCLDAST